MISCKLFYRGCLSPPVKQRGRFHCDGPATQNGESRLDTGTSYVASSIVGSKSEEETTERTFLQDYRNLLARPRALWQCQMQTCWSHVETAPARPIAVCPETEGSPFEHLLQPLRGAFYNLLPCAIWQTRVSRKLNVLGRHVAQNTVFVTRIFTWECASYFSSLTDLDSHLLQTNATPHNLQVYKNYNLMHLDSNTPKQVLA